MAIRRVDPNRRDRIIDAALDLIAEEGVAGTSHRKVARRADVPLGSMTYHFENMDELLREAFSRFTVQVSARFDGRMATATTIEEARTAVADIIHIDMAESMREHVLSHELYTLASRKPAFRDLTRAWMTRSRKSLERHFDETTARQLDALIEGISIHQALETSPHDRAITVDSIAKITTA